MVIAAVGGKGGTGKSTLAISLASELLARGRSVLLIDSDLRNRTSLRAAAMAEEQGRAHAVTIGMSAEELCKAGGVPKLKRNFDFVVIDAPGRSGVDLTAPLMVADVGLFPSAPTTADAGVFESQLELLAPVRYANKGLRLAIVLTKLLSRTSLSDGTEAQGVFAPTGLRVLQSKTFTRVAWQRCLDVGVGVAQHSPKSRAADELRALVNELMRLRRKS